MPLTYQQIENNLYFVTILNICNPLHTSFTMFREIIKDPLLGKNISLSNDALFLEEHNFGLIVSGHLPPLLT